MSDTILTHGAPSHSQPADTPTPRSVAALVTLATFAFTPLLFLHAKKAWETSDSWFYPLVILAGLGVLTSKRFKVATSGEAGNKSIVWPLFGLAGLLLAMAGVLVSPWLGTVAALLMLTTFVYGWGGVGLIKVVGPLLFALSLAIALPPDRNAGFNFKTQALLLKWTSAVLDLQKIENIPLGNFIELPGKSVSIANSGWSNPGLGATSLYSVLALAVLFVTYKKVPFLRAIALVCTAPILFFFGNLARVLAEVHAYSNWNIDPSSKLIQLLAGILTLVAIFASLVCMNALYTLMAMALSAIWQAGRKQWQHWRKKRRMWEAITTGEQPGDRRIQEEEPEGPQQDLIEPIVPARSTRFLTTWPILATFVVLGLMQWIWAWPGLTGALQRESVITGKLQAAVAPETLPQLLDPRFERSYLAEQRSTNLDFGKNTNSWTYKLGPIQVEISVNYPFRGWHEATNGLAQRGWVLQRRSIEDLEAGQGVEAVFSMPTGLHGLLAFRSFDSLGNPLEIPDPSSQGRPTQAFYELARNIKIWDPATRERLRQSYQPTDQVQVFVTAPRPLTNEDLQQVRKWLETACEKIQAAIVANPQGAQS